MSYAIVVRVPEARRTCFVAKPFAPEFNAVRDSITNAALAVGLEPVQLDVQHLGPQFTQTVDEQIRAARVVVGVCSPEQGTAETNPNVTFEVGLATALGKPTLLLTDDVQAVPSNLCNRDFLVYNQEDVKSGKLTIQIVSRLSEIIVRTGQNPLTDPRYRDISVAEAHHWRILHPEWWRLFFQILRLAKQVHHEFQSLDSGFLDNLRATAEQVVCNYHEVGTQLEVPMKVAINLDSLWYEMLAYYHARAERKIIANWNEQSAESDQSFGDLLAFVGSDLKEQEGVQASGLLDLRKKLLGCKESFEGVKTKVGGYKGFIAPLDGVQDVRGKVRSPEMVNLQAKITEVSRRTKAIVIDADNLILELLDVIMEDEPHG